ncbi:hypothetical protein D9Q98_007072 [Chlorella vulgaris]|uniref:Methyltransferase FkbM domain-containing protein n=1 Tax=Chlorella vulgaris TaxID=3077 RepID=A0A9D4TJF1_CHLVU|nr:hypothetical protein D9Q98_007072 [Chlorella vulgaris]
MPLLQPSPQSALAPRFPAKGSVTPPRQKQQLTKTLDGLQIKESCMNGHAEELAAAYLERASVISNFTACPSKQWLVKMHEVLPGAQHFVDIGCSEGYFSALIFGLWAPTLGLNPRALRQQAPAMPCGACNECKEKVSPVQASGRQAGMQVVCVEPDPLSYAHIIGLRQHFNNSSSQGTHWRLMQASVGSKSSSSGPFCDVGESGSNCSTAVPGSGRNSEDVDVVAATTVDELLAMHKLNRVDLLKIDAGGEEVAALSGAIASIAGDRVGVLAFACGGQGAWKHGQLGEVVARLDELGYTCYLAGQETQHGSLARLTGCWRPSYETQHRSTVVCVPRGHLLYPHTERMSLRYGQHEQVYFKQLQAAPAQQSEAAAAAEGKELGSQQKLSAGQPVHQPVTAGAGGQPVDPGSDADVQPTAAQQSETQEPALAARKELPVTTKLSAWLKEPERLVFQEPQSGCRLYPDGSVERPEGWAGNKGMPFLFDTAPMPSRETACKHCPAVEKPPLCCGVCSFETRRCSELYPGENKTEETAQLLMDSGYDLHALTPCELFQRIRGRTLWFAGDSQTWHFFYSAECFLRNFAPSLHRTPPVPWALNQQLITVTWPVKVPPICLELALDTRVCAVRVDSVPVFTSKVMPLLHHNTPGFNSGIMIYNAGLHYGTPGADGKPANSSQLYRDLEGLVVFKQRYGREMPKLVWMDTPVQHFSAHDGSYNGGEKPFACKPLAAWEAGDAVVTGGGRRNIPVAPLVPRFADAHLRTWNASVPLWDTHKPGECTHWCSPSAYHLWLFLLNDLMRENGLGTAAAVLEEAEAAGGTKHP